MQFLKDVSLGRNTAISDIKPYADGRVMNGETALKYKLIDGIGTYDDAIVKARSLAKLSGDAPVYDQTGSPFEYLFMSLDGLLGKKSIDIPLKQKNFSMLEYIVEP
jgi:protease-4